MATIPIMGKTATTFTDVTRCEDVSTSSTLGRGKPLHPRRRSARKRSARLNVRQPITEQIRWKVEAEDLGLTLSGYVRAKVNETPVKVVRVTDPALVREIRRAGLNVARLLHREHARRPVDAALRDAVLEAFAAVYQRLLQEYA